ncbi:hypothetical protein BO70DRAFT_304902, partial [Aspergillus heteromorphus CBS 117.55]
SGVRVVICRGCFGCGPPSKCPGTGRQRGWRIPSWAGCPCPCKAPSTSRVVWECSSKWVVNFI